MNKAKNNKAVDKQMISTPIYDKIEKAKIEKILKEYLRSEEVKDKYFQAYVFGTREQLDNFYRKLDESMRKLAEEFVF